MIKIGVTGGCGRMGQAIIKCSESFTYLRIVQVYERPEHKLIGSEVSVSSDQRVVISNINQKSIKGINVLIDFSTPEATLKNLKIAKANKVAMVIGTTGFSASQKRAIKESSKKIAIVMAPNMSLGANLLFALAARATKVLGDAYDIEVMEAHHKHKVDSPSGTAHALAESIAKEMKWKLSDVEVYRSRGSYKKRPRKQIGMHVIRAGEIVGEHTALFAGAGEKIELKHQASSRDAFAQGALVAAAFLKKKKKGFYSMANVLGLEGKK